VLKYRISEWSGIFDAALFDCIEMIWMRWKLADLFHSEPSPIQNRRCTPHDRISQLTTGLS
jgi:hypothetical protein